MRIKILGIPVSGSEQECRLLEAVDANNNTFRIWMEIDTTLMSKTKIKYEKEKRK